MWGEVTNGYDFPKLLLLGRCMNAYTYIVNDSSAVCSRSGDFFHNTYKMSDTAPRVPQTTQTQTIYKTTAAFFVIHQSRFDFLSLSLLLLLLLLQQQLLRQIDRLDAAHLGISQQGTQRMMTRFQKRVPAELLPSRIDVPHPIRWCTFGNDNGPVGRIQCPDQCSGQRIAPVDSQIGGGGSSTDCVRNCNFVRFVHSLEVVYIPVAM